MEAAHRRDIDVVLVWRLDRWDRSLLDLVSTLKELNHLGVGFVSLTEALDLSAQEEGPFGPPGKSSRAIFAFYSPGPPLGSSPKKCWLLVQQTVQSCEGLPGGQHTSCEWALHRQTAMEPPSEEDGLLRSEDMWEAALIQHYG